MSAVRARKTREALAIGRAVHARRATTLRAHQLLRRATEALEALHKGDDSAADSSLKAAMLAAGDAREALQPALIHPAPVAGLEEWTS